MKLPTLVLIVAMALGTCACDWLPPEEPQSQVLLPPHPTPPPTTLPALARYALTTYLTDGQIPPPPHPLPPAWQHQQGVFVTLSIQGQMRGCWGSLSPTAANLAQATIHAAIGAATRDPRYPPLRLGELEQVRIQVALIQAVTPLAEVRSLDPTRFGLWLRSGSRGAVLLPGEALTVGWQLSRAKALAGIPADAPVELFRVTAELLHEF
ncbi:MAG: AMMECR1 domain-containing protein [Thermostichales cyanobacterium GMQP_bins_62]